MVTVAVSADTATPTRVPRRVRVSSVAALTFGVAGCLHLVAAITHVPVLATAHVSTGHHLAGGDSTTHWLVAIALAMLAAVQLFVAGALWVSPFTDLAVIGIVVNAVALCLYVLSRTAGLPLGENAWHAETVGLLDLTVAAVEVAGIVALTACLPARTRAKATNALLVAGLVMLGVRLAVGLIT